MGNAWIESQPGAGAHVRVQMPIDGMETINGKIRVLLADDHATLGAGLRLLINLLEREATKTSMRLGIRGE